MMEWNVYLEDVNRQEIKVWNVFEHSVFNKEVQNLLCTCSDKGAFSAELERSVIYYFAWKCEYEVVLTSWPPYITAAEVKRITSEGPIQYRTTYNPEVGKKIDVAKQLALNWDRFVDYCWDFSPAAEDTTSVKTPQKVKVRKANK